MLEKTAGRPLDSLNRQPQSRSCMQCQTERALGIAHIYASSRKSWTGTNGSSMMSFTMAPISHYVYGRTTPAPEVPREHKSEQNKQEPINTQKAKGTARERQTAMVGRARAKEAHPQSRKMPRQPRARVQIRSCAIIALYGGVLLLAPTHRAHKAGEDQGGPHFSPVWDDNTRD